MSRNINQFLFLTLLVSGACLTNALFQPSLSASREDPNKYSLVQQGYEQIQKGLYPDAIKTLCKAAQADRNNIVARRYLALALTKAGSYQTAIDQLDLVSKLGSPAAFDQYLYGEAYYGLEKFSEAAAAYQKAIDMHKTFDAARGGMIKSLVKLNQFDQARQACLDGLKQATTADAKKYYQTIFQGVQEISLNPGQNKEMQSFCPTPGAGTGPISVGMHSSE